MKCFSFFIPSPPEKYTFCVHRNNIFSFFNLMFFIISQNVNGSYDFTVNWQREPHWEPSLLSLWTPISTQTAGSHFTRWHFPALSKKFQAKARHGGLWGSRYLSVQAHLCEMGPGHHFTADPAMKKLEQFHLVYISASCLCQLHFLWKFLLLWWVAGWFIKTVSWHHAQSPDSLTSPPQLKNRLQGCFVEKVISLKQNFFSSPGD